MWTSVCGDFISKRPFKTTHFGPDFDALFWKVSRGNLTLLASLRPIDHPSNWSSVQSQKYHPSGLNFSFVKKWSNLEQNYLEMMMNVSDVLNWSKTKREHINRGRKLFMYQCVHAVIFHIAIFINRKWRAAIVLRANSDMDECASNWDEFHTAFITYLIQSSTNNNNNNKIDGTNNNNNNSNSSTNKTLESSHKKPLRLRRHSSFLIQSLSNIAKNTNKSVGFYPNFLSTKKNIFLRLILSRFTVYLLVRFYVYLCVCLKKTNE